MLEIRLASRKDANSLTALSYESYIGHFGHLWPEKQALADFLADDFAAPSLEKSFAEPHCYWLIASLTSRRARMSVWRSCCARCPDRIPARSAVN